MVTSGLNPEIIDKYQVSMTRYLGRNEILNQKIMNSTVLPCFQFGMNCQVFPAARLTWPAYVNGRKLENSSF